MTTPSIPEILDQLDPTVAENEMRDAVRYVSLLEGLLDGAFDEGRLRPDEKGAFVDVTFSRDLVDDILFVAGKLYESVHGYDEKMRPLINRYCNITMEIEMGKRRAAPEQLLP